jgi:hypothetical protein
MSQSRSDKPVVIALGYRSGVGKDTIGDYLVERHGFVRLAFADIIKRDAMSLYGLTEYEVFVDKDVPIARLHGKTPRHYVQLTGDTLRNESAKLINVIRELVHVLNRQGRDVVITDMRMQSELKMLQDDHDINEILWCVERKSVVSINENDTLHETETALADFHGWNDTIFNNGTRAELFAIVEQKLSTI